MSGVRVRRATAADLDALAAFVARLNARPEVRCLMLPETAEDIRGDMNAFPEPAERHFVLAEEGGGLVGAAACDWDREEKRGWVVGPFVAPARWDAVAPALLEALGGLLPPEVRKLDTYTDVANERAYALYRATGYVDYKRAEVWVAERPEAGVLASFAPGTGLPPEHEPAFLVLHEASFPATPEPGHRLLATRDAEHVLYGAADGAAFAGYIAIHLTDSPREGFVSYLAVEPSARKRGHGRALLQAALRWAFLEHQVPRVSLIVENQNLGARRLYESSGFRLVSSGLSTRREW